MKIVFSAVTIFIFLNNYIFACSGSCLLCHEKLNLEKPKEHKIISQCISCHQKGCSEDSLLDENKSSDTSCGADCFDCHKTLPQDFTHKQITKCVKCHYKLNTVR